MDTTLTAPRVTPLERGRPKIDFARATDVHLGLIALDPAAPPRAPRHHAVAYDSERWHLELFAHGDSWTEWGEAVEVAPRVTPGRIDGKHRNAPAYHVIVRFPDDDDAAPLRARAEDKLRDLDPSGRRWARRDSEVAQYLGAEAVHAVRDALGLFLADGYRLSDYACLSSSADWSERPHWDTRAGSTPDLVTFYA